MDRQFFTALFNAALARRERALANGLLDPWFQGHPLPPVIGFGLPASAPIRVPLVTVGLNPSGEEYPEHVPANDDANEQWDAQTAYFHRRAYREWFDRSELIVSALTGARYSHYGQPSVPHLDLTPLGTTGAFDRIYDKEVSPTQRLAARSMIYECVAGTLLPVLADLAQHHGVTHVVVYGFVPGQRPAGNRTMKEVFAELPIFRTEARVPGPVTIARGSFDAEHGTIRPHVALTELVVLFMSKGPSSRSGGELLADAAQAMRRLGWATP